MKNFILFVIVLLAAFLLLTRFDIGNQTPPDFSNQESRVQDFDPKTDNLEDHIPSTYQDGLVEARELVNRWFEQVKTYLNNLVGDTPEKINQKIEEAL
jgi:hypothetical protein